MMIGAVNLLVVSGLSPVDADPWQAWLETRFPQATWVRPLDGDWPDLDRWGERIDQALAGGGGRPWLALAHGFGALALVRHAFNSAHGLSGAMLVAPADPARFGHDLASLGHALPVPASVIALQGGAHDASPWLQDVPARDWAAAWGARLVDAGVGPTLPPSPWAEGEALLAHHLQSLDATPRVLSAGAPAAQDAYASAHRFVGVPRRAP